MFTKQLLSQNDKSTNVMSNLKKKSFEKEEDILSYMIFSRIFTAVFLAPAGGSNPAGYSLAKLK